MVRKFLFIVWLEGTHTMEFMRVFLPNLWRKWTVH